MSFVNICNCIKKYILCWNSINKNTQKVGYNLEDCLPCWLSDAKLCKLCPWSYWKVSYYHHTGDDKNLQEWLLKTLNFNYYEQQQSITGILDKCWRRTTCENPVLLHVVCVLYVKWRQTDFRIREHHLFTKYTNLVCLGKVSPQASAKLSTH